MTLFTFEKNLKLGTKQVLKLYFQLNKGSRKKESRVPMENIPTLQLYASSCVLGGLYPLSPVNMCRAGLLESCGTSHRGVVPAPGTAFAGSQLLATPKCLLGDTE